MAFEVMGEVEERLAAAVEIYRNEWRTILLRTLRARAEDLVLDALLEVQAACPHAEMVQRLEYIHISDTGLSGYVCVACHRVQRFCSRCRGAQFKESYARWYLCDCERLRSLPGDFSI
jgi:hypothetical protein